MIVKAYKYKGSAGARRLNEYLWQNKGQRTELCEIRNLYVTDTLAGMRVMQCLQRASRAKIAFWHIVISPTTKLNEKDRSRVLDLIVAELKATDHPLIVWSHDEKLRARRGGGASHFHCVLGHVSPTTDLALDMRNHVQRLQKAAAIAAFEIEGQTSVSSYHHSIVTHLIRQGRPDVARWLTDLAKNAAPLQQPRMADAMRRSAAAAGLELASLHAKLQRLWDSGASEQAFDKLLSDACVMIRRGDRSRDSVLLHRGDRLVGVLHRVLRRPRALVYEEASERFPGLFDKPRIVSEGTQSGPASTIEQLRQRTTDRLEAMLKDMRTTTLMLTYNPPHPKAREEADEDPTAKRLKKTAQWEAILNRAIDLLWSDDRWVSVPIEKLIIRAGRSLNAGSPFPVVRPATLDPKIPTRQPLEAVALNENPAALLSEDEVLPYEPYGFKI
jgi:hypothetical protein